MTEFPFGEVDDDHGPGAWVVEERPPLREGKIFVDYGERATIAEHLEAAYVALNQAFRGIWVEKAAVRAGRLGAQLGPDLLVDHRLLHGGEQPFGLVETETKVAGRQDIPRAVAVKPYWASLTSGVPGSRVGKAVQRPSEDPMHPRSSSLVVRRAAVAARPRHPERSSLLGRLELLVLTGNPGPVAVGHGGTQ